MKKPKAAKPQHSKAPAAKKAPAWHPVSVAQQRKQHHAAVKAAASRKQHAAAKKAKPAVRKLAAPGESCVIDACYALTGHRLDVDAGDGLFIPDALEMLATLGVITGFGAADLDAEPVPGLILGLDLPGPHAVVTAPGGWWQSWCGLYDPADFPDAVIEEAWAVTW